MNEVLEPTVLVESLSTRNVSVPLQTMTKAKAVYVETRSRILRGMLAPGSAVNQEALAADLGVSITPLREALRRLEMEGLIRLEAHRTIVIAPLTSQELNEIYVVRMELDPLAARLAAANASESELDVIRQLARQEAVSDPVPQLERNRGFHRAVYSSSQNGALISILDQLWDRADRYRLILIREELVEGPTSQQEHIDIAEAVATRKAESAARLMRAHIERSHTRISDIVMAWAAEGGERPGHEIFGEPMTDADQTGITLAERLSALDTATLYESGASGTMTAEIKILSGDRRLAGPALTVMCRPGDNLMVHVAVACAKSGAVMVVQSHDASYGVWGEVLTVAAMARGIAGLVVDGSVRDLGAIRHLGFPVFARGTALRGTTKCARGTIGAVITCGGTPVSPADLIVADESGVVVIRPEEAEHVLARAQERCRKEAAMMNELRAGRTTMELLGLDERSAGD